MKTSILEINSEIKPNDVAQKRFEIIFPLLKAKKKMFEEVSLKENISISTLYRWRKLYSSTGLIESLIDKKSGGVKGICLLTLEQEKIISEAIKSNYLTNSRESANKTIQIIFEKCIKQNIKPPNPVTIKKRIKKISGEDILNTKGFSLEEEDFIKKNYLNMTKRELARVLNRSYRGVAYRFKKLGLTIPEDVLNKRLLAARFKPGCIPYKKLKDFEETIKKEKGGRVYIQIRLPGEKKLVNKHCYVWETYNNKKVPENHRIIFKDGDTFNLHPENLECVHKNDMNFIIGNSLQNLPNELIEIALLKQDINKEIKKYKKNDKRNP